MAFWDGKADALKGSGIGFMRIEGRGDQDLEVYSVGRQAYI